MTPKVMVVDDNFQSRMVASEILENDYELQLAECGEACLVELSRFKPDVILLNWQMPGLDGMEVLIRIRGMAAFKNVKIIMIKAGARPEDITRAWRAGADDFIITPFDRGLLDSVACQVKEKRQQDRTDEKFLEMAEGIRQAQKMEALGTLAGGIAHDFNNILFPIQAFAELLAEHRDPEVAKEAGEIKTAAMRAGRLVGQILSFSRQSRHSIQPVALDIIVKEVLKLIKASFPANIRIRSRINPSCGIVMADPTSIHQVVMNLCTNAKHAMEKNGGTLKVWLTDHDPGGKEGGQASESGFLALEVGDTGCGIPPEIRKRIFKPFFTTKPPGKGTGMGLSVVKGIIDELGGKIRIKSRVGKGTSFRILFPVRSEECGLPEEKVEDVVGGDECVLVVDDEKTITDILARSLKGLGYRVRTYTKPGQALSELDEGVDLVITDMTMPGMSGTDLAQKILEQRPDMPVLLMTGFSEDLDGARARKMGIRDVLYKPVGRKDIAAAIREALAGDMNPLGRG